MQFLYHRTGGRRVTKVGYRGHFLRVPVFVASLLSRLAYLDCWALGHKFGEVEIFTGNYPVETMLWRSCVRNCGQGISFSTSPEQAPQMLAAAVFARSKA